MYIQIGLILMIIFFAINTGMSFGQTNQSKSQYFTPTRDDLESSEGEKIDQVLTEWQNSENPTEYANQHNLPYKEDKIAVYIYLENPKFKSEIPLEIEIISGNKEIIRAFVTPDELYALAKLNFVTRITLPVQAEKLPISKVEQPQTPEETNNYFWVILPTILIIITLLALKIKRKPIS